MVTKDGPTFRATVDVVEWLGNEACAYIPFEAPPEVKEQLAELERDLDGESLRTQLVVNLDGASDIKEGDEAEIWLDVTKMHLSSIRRPARTSRSTSPRPAASRRGRAHPPDRTRGPGEVAREVGGRHTEDAHKVGKVHRMPSVTVVGTCTLCPACRATVPL